MKKITVLLLLAAFAFFQCDKKTTPPADPTVKGCGDFVVYKKLNSNQMMRIYIDNKITTFSKDLQVFEEIQTAPFASITIEQNNEFDKIWRRACNDVGESLINPSITWTLQKGKLSYKVDKVLAEYGCMESYRATVLLENATFKNNDTGETIDQTKVEMNDVFVGWCAG